MKFRNHFLLFWFLLTINLPAFGQPLAVHPDNPHYFLFNGKPTILITSGEHYGAVMNKAFDYIRYLNTLQKAGFNYTRLFCSGHVEIDDGTFGIEKNTMGPSPENYLAPWKKIRSRKDTLIGVYDLDQWNPAYFERLKHFVEEAGKRNIVVEITLSSSCYSPEIWTKNPLYTANNINLSEMLPIKRVHTIYNGPLLHYQQMLVAKLVKELNPYDNIFFELQNEPWSDQPSLVEFIPDDKKTRGMEWQKLAEIANPVSMAWQSQLHGIIRQTEVGMLNKHLVAQNISNFRARVQHPDPLISILNFHYALPEAAFWNMDVNKMIGLDETGFMPHEDFLYRRQAWQFLLAGGALYNNLDYSFTVGHEDGSWSINNNPGWGGVSFRNQLTILKSFMDSLDFIHMQPDQDILLKKMPESLSVQILSGESKQIALYAFGCDSANLELKVQEGKYLIQSLNPATGLYTQSTFQEAPQGKLSLSIQPGKEDIAIRITRL